MFWSGVFLCKLVTLLLCFLCLLVVLLLLLGCFVSCLLCCFDSFVGLAASLFLFCLLRLGSFELLPSFELLLAEGFRCFSPVLGLLQLLLRLLDQLLVELSFGSSFFCFVGGQGLSESVELLLASLDFVCWPTAGRCRLLSRVVVVLVVLLLFVGQLFLELFDLLLLLLQLLLLR